MEPTVSSQTRTTQDNEWLKSGPRQAPAAARALAASRRDPRAAARRRTAAGGQSWVCEAISRSRGVTERAAGGGRGPPGPVSTYRLQLHTGFGFAEAAAIADYLAGLGVSHVYLSPILQAAPGS